MTAQRLVRSGKARIFIIISAVLLVLAAIYHHENIVSEYDNLKKRYDTCSQQVESLSVNLQVIVDYKNKLEKTLQQEKSEHKQTRTELEGKINSEKLQRDKYSEDANKRYATLQQHYKLLQTEHDDLKLKAEKNEEEVEQLQIKVKELEDEARKIETDKQKTIEDLKNQYMQMQVDKEELEKKIQGQGDQQTDFESQVNHLTKERNQLLREINFLKNKPDAALNSQPFEPPKFPDEPQKNFNKQLEVGDNVYKIADNNNLPFSFNGNENISAKSEKNENNHEDSLNLPQPQFGQKSTQKTSSTSNNLAGAQPLNVPTVTPETKRKDFLLDNDSNTDFRNKKVPQGVVPFPKSDVKDQKTENEKNIPDEVNNALPNRYRNNIIDSEIQNEIKETQPEANKDDKSNLKVIPQRLPEENNKMEEQNQDKNNAQEVIDQPKLKDQNEMKMEENELQNNVLQRIDSKRKKHIDSLNNDKNHEGNLNKPEQYEGEGDYDKDGHKEDLNEENEQEGEEDDDGDDDGEYIEARHKEPAVRN